MKNDRKTAKMHVPEHQKEQLMFKTVKAVSYTHLTLPTTPYV